MEAEFIDAGAVGISQEDIELNNRLMEESAREAAGQPQAETPPETNPPAPDTTQVPPDQTDSTPKREVYKFKVKGADAEYSHNQIQSMLAREQTFQQKYDQLRESEDHKLGLLLAAAKSGDNGAKREVYELLKDSMGDGDLLDLEDVEDKFDHEAALKRTEVNDVDDAFADVANDVDYQETLDKIKSQIAPHMQDSVFQSYWDNPVERRVMYDFAKSGRTDEIFSALEAELNKLPFGERVAIKKDPEAYGIAIGEVLKSLSAPSSTKSMDQGTTNLSSVSTGQGSHRVEKADGPPDFDKMTMAEFQQWQIENFGKIL